MNFRFQTFFSSFLMSDELYILNHIKNLQLSTLQLAYFNKNLVYSIYTAIVISHMHIYFFSMQELKSNIRNHQSETKECLQRICPSVSIDSSLVNMFKTVLCYLKIVNAL